MDGKCKGACDSDHERLHASGKRGKNWKYNTYYDGISAMMDACVS